MSYPGGDLSGSGKMSIYHTLYAALLLHLWIGYIPLSQRPAIAKAHYHKIAFTKVSEQTLN